MEDLPVFGDEVSEEPPSKKRITNCWHIEESFENKQFAIAFIEAEEIWAIRKSNVSVKNGFQTFYSCNKVSVKKSMNECPAKIYLLHSVDDGKYYLYRNNFDHIHDADGQVKAVPKKIARLDILEKVKEYVHSGLKPRAISDRIRRDAEIEIKPIHAQVLILI